MIEFRPYASSSAGNLYTVSDGETILMLECGLPWKKAQQLLEFRTSDIGGVLLTHSHMDHCRGAEGAAKAGLDIYASRQTFDALSVPEHRANAIEDGKLFEVGTWAIMPFGTIHDTEGSFGFYMADREGEGFLYITDSAYCPVRFKRLDVIAVECNFDAQILTDNIIEGRVPWFVGKRIRRSHFSLDTVIGLLKANDLSHCSAIHLLHLSSGNSDERLMIRKVQEATGIPTFACEE